MLQGGSPQMFSFDSWDFFFFFLSNISKYCTFTEYSGFLACLGTAGDVVTLGPQSHSRHLPGPFERCWAWGVAGSPTRSLHFCYFPGPQGSLRTAPSPSPCTFTSQVSTREGGPSSRSHRGCWLFSELSLRRGVLERPGSATVTKPQGELRICCPRRDWLL